jgi:F0F1-type ATP synthase assembly protein I
MSGKPELSIVTQFLTLGTTMAGTVATGVVVGWAADDVFHSSPIGLLVGLGLGIVGAVSALISLLKRWS